MWIRNVRKNKIIVTLFHFLQEKPWKNVCFLIIFIKKKTFVFLIRRFEKPFLSGDMRACEIVFTSLSNYYIRDFNMLNQRALRLQAVTSKFRWNRSSVQISHTRRLSLHGGNAVRAFRNQLLKWNEPRSNYYYRANSAGEIRQKICKCRQNFENVITNLLHILYSRYWTRLLLLLLLKTTTKVHTSHNKFSERYFTSSEAELPLQMCVLRKYYDMFFLYLERLPFSRSRVRRKMSGLIWSPSGYYPSRWCTARNYHPDVHYRYESIAREISVISFHHRPAKERSR